MFNKVNPLYLLLVLSLILAACGPTATQETPEPVVETLVVTEELQATPVEVIPVVTPTPEPGGPRTLVVCLDDKPTLETWIAEAIDDGPIDINSYTFQPVILKKLPSLADGDATLTTVTVSEGETVVDANGEVVNLDPAADPPIMLVPAGGGDPLSYQGDDFELDQMTVTFKLLPGLKWSDGEPLTAADSVYAYNLGTDERIATYEAIDDLTFQWTGLPGFRDQYYSINMADPLPEQFWGQYSPAELDEMEDYEFVHAPVSWGPYYLEEWMEGESITLHKNPHYYRADEGLPKFDRVIFHITDDNSINNIANLLAGECDIVSSNLADQIEMLLELQEAGKIRATFTTGNVWEGLDFGIQHLDYDDGYQLGIDRPDFFSDVRTRRAFAMCIDRQALVDTIFHGQSLVPDTYLPPQHPLYNPEVQHYDFDVAAGSALLEEVGWVDDDDDPSTPRVAQGVPNVLDGTYLEVDYETSSRAVRQQVTAIIKDSLAQCGIKANIQLHDSSEWFGEGPENFLSRRKDLVEFGWYFDFTTACDIYQTDSIPGPTGETWISIQDGLERTFGELGLWAPNRMGFTNEAYDLACSVALSSEPGQPEYEAARKEVLRILSEQLPFVPLFLTPKVIAMRPDMCGVIVDPCCMTELWNIEEFDYGEGCEE